MGTAGSLAVMKLKSSVEWTLVELVQPSQILQANKGRCLQFTWEMPPLQGYLHTGTVKSKFREAKELNCPLQAKV